jgi:hypothetical protein
MSMRIFQLASMTVLTLTLTGAKLPAQDSHNHMKGMDMPMKHPETMKAASALKPAQGAAVKITAPKAGQIIKGDAVPLEFKLTKGKIGEHVHAYLDGEMAGMFKGSKGTLNGIKPGQHVLKRKRVWFYVACSLLAACSSDLAPRGEDGGKTGPLRFSAEVFLGRAEVNPAAPFLRVADGRLFAVWTEDVANQKPKSSEHAGHHATGKMAPSPMRDLFLAASTDGGTTWSSAKRINRSNEAIQAEENGPKIAFGPDNRAYVVWSIPGEKGDKTRANIRFAMDDGKGGFTAARTLNEVKDTARFPILEFSATSWSLGSTGASIIPSHANFF